MATHLPNPDSPSQPMRWRFSLRTALLATAYVAFVCAWLKWFWGEEGWWLFLPRGFAAFAVVGMMVVFTFPNRRYYLVNGWMLLVAGWLVALGDYYLGMVEAFSVMDSSDGVVRRWQVQIGIRVAASSAFTGPVFCTLPVIYFLTVVHRSYPPRAWWPIYLALAAALIDAGLVAVLVPRLFPV